MLVFQDPNFLSRRPLKGAKGTACFYVKKGRTGAY